MRGANTFVCVFALHCDVAGHTVYNQHITPACFWVLLLLADTCLNSLMSKRGKLSCFLFIYCGRKSVGDECKRVGIVGVAGSMCIECMRVSL